MQFQHKCLENNTLHHYWVTHVHIELNSKKKKQFLHRVLHEKTFCFTLAVHIFISFRWNDKAIVFIGWKNYRIFFAYRYEAAAMHPLCLCEVTLECHHLTFSVVVTIQAMRWCCAFTWFECQHMLFFQLYSISFVVEMSSSLRRFERWTTEIYISFSSNRLSQIHSRFHFHSFARVQFSLHNVAWGKWPFAMHQSDHKWSTVMVSHDIWAATTKQANQKISSKTIDQLWQPIFFFSYFHAHSHFTFMENSDSDKNCRVFESRHFSFPWCDVVCGWLSCSGTLIFFSPSSSSVVQIVVYSEYRSYQIGSMHDWKKQTTSDD